MSSMKTLRCTCRLLAYNHRADRAIYSFCDSVLNEQVTIDHHDYPSFMYPDNDSFDQDNVDTGLCRGELMLKVCAPL